MAAAHHGGFTMEAFARLERSGVVFLIIAYCVLHWTIRLATGSVYTTEEAEQLLLSQSFEPGYVLHRPPLMAWLLAALGEAGLLAPAAVFAVKYAVLAAALVLFYLAARNILTRRGVSAAAVGSWGLAYYTAWGFHEDLLTGVLLMATASMTLHAATRILTWRRTRDWVYFGVSMGLGALSSHLYIVFPIALVAAILVSPFFRNAFGWGRFGMALVIAALIYAPYAVWLAQHVVAVDELKSAARAIRPEPGWIWRVRDGALTLGHAIVSFLVPFALMWGLLFWTLWLPIVYPIYARRSTDEEVHEAAWRALLARTVVFALLILASGLILGVPRYYGYWMIPALLVAPIWLFEHVRRAGDFPVSIRAYAGLIVVFVAAIAVGRVAVWRLEINECAGLCRGYTPVKELAGALKDSGFSVGTIVGDDLHLTGNLRGALTQARVLDASLPLPHLPAPKTRGACLAVWRDDPTMPKELSAFLDERLKAPHSTSPEGAIHRNLLLSNSSAVTLYFQFVPPSDACR